MRFPLFKKKIKNKKFERLSAMELNVAFES
jgi:hypothetical protein